MKKISLCRCAPKGDWVLAQFGKKRARAQRQYQKFVRAGVATWEQLTGKSTQGSKAFIDTQAVPNNTLSGKLAWSTRRAGHPHRVACHAPKTERSCHRAPQSMPSSDDIYWTLDRY